MKGGTDASGKTDCTAASSYQQGAHRPQAQIIGTPEDIRLGTGGFPQGSLLHSSLDTQAWCELIIETFGRAPGMISGRVRKISHGSHQPLLCVARSRFRVRTCVLLPHFQIAFVFLQLFIPGKANQGLVEFTAGFGLLALMHKVAYQPSLGSLVGTGVEQVTIQNVGSLEVAVIAKSTCQF